MTRKYDNLEVGTRIYYTGDMANGSSFGAIINIRPAGRFGPQCYDIVFDEVCFEGDTQKSALGIWPCMFEPSPGRRFWLETEWQADRQRRIEDMRRSFPKSAA